MIRPYKSRGSAAGIAIVAVLISAVVFLGIIIAITGTLSLSSRQSTGDQRVTLEAQYAAESGLSRVTSEGQAGVLRTWSRLMFQMATSSTASANDIRNLAARFCNYADSSVVPTPTATQYCSNNSTGTVTDRYEVFASLIPLTAYADPALTPAPATVPTTIDGARTFWADVFSAGNLGTAGSGVRFSETVSPGTRYDVAFGLEPAGVLLREDPNSPSYVFQFRIRDAVSTGIMTTGTTVLSRRMSQRNFPDIYEIVVTPPNLSSFLSLTDQQSSVNQSGNLDKTIFSSNSLFDGPVHTNGAFYMRGKPWFSNSATSAGCRRSAAGALNYNPSLAQPTCTEATVTGYYNDGDLLEDSNYTAFTVTNGKATFPGYDGTPNKTAPEFVKDNFNPNSTVNYTPTSGSEPWGYTGKYDARIVRLPTTSSRQRQMASAPNPPYPSDPTRVGILVETGVNPSAGQYYLSPAPEVYVQATDSGMTTSTDFGTVTNNGTNADYQLIRIKAKKKISNCRAGPASIAIAPDLFTMSIGASKGFRATVTPSQTDYTFTLAPTALTVDNWQVMSNPTGNVGNLVASGAGNLDGTYSSVSGGTPVGQPVTIRVNGLGGTQFAEAQIQINPAATTLGNIISVSPTEAVGVNWQANSSPFNRVTVTWPTAGGSAPFTYKLYAFATTSATFPALLPFPGSFVEVATTTATSETVIVNTATRNQYIYFRVKAIGSTGLEALSSNTVRSFIRARSPAVTYTGATTATASYDAPSKTFTYAGGVITPAWSVNNSFTQDSNSGVGIGAFTGQIEMQSRDLGNSWPSPWNSVPSGSGITATATTNFTRSVTLPLNTTSVVREYRFQMRARNTTTGLDGIYVTSDTFKVARIVDPVVTLDVPSPSTLEFGGGTGTSLNWSINSGPNTPGPFDYTVQRQNGAGWDNLAVNPPANSFPVTPTLTSSYRVLVRDLTTTRTADSVVRTVTVELLPLPEIISFQPQNLPSGPNNTLLWTVKNAATVATEKIYPTAVTYTPATFVPNGTLQTGNRNVTVDNPYSDYRLTATNATGSVTRMLRVYNNGGVGGPGFTAPPPSNVTFTASPPTVYFPNNTSTLAWGATNAATSTINGVNVSPKLAGGDTTTVTLSTTTTYTLVVSNPSGSVTRTATVTYIPANPPEVNLTAANVSSSPSASTFNFGGGTANFLWDVVNKNAGANISGAGPDPYTYVLEGRVDGGAWSTITTRATPSFSGLPISANNTIVPVVRDYRVTATNDGTKLSGTSLNQSLTVNPSQTPSITLDGNGPFPHPGGNASLTWSINNQAAAGVGPYSYQLERETGALNSNNWGTAFSATTPFGEAITATKRYRLTARNTVTGKEGTKTVIVVVNPPDPPQITAFTATPNQFIVDPAPTLSRLTWTLSSLATRPYTQLILNGPGIPANTNVFGQPSYDVPVTVYGINTYTLTAKGPTGLEASRPTTVNFKPPEVLVALVGSGSVARDSKSGAFNPGWTVLPNWSSNRTGNIPTVTAANYSYAVTPDDGILTANITAGGAVSITVGDLPNAKRPGETYTLTVKLNVNGVAKEAQFTVYVGETGSGGSLRPRARLTQGTCQFGGPVDYSWPTFIDYIVEKNPLDGSMRLYRREYGSTIQTDHVKPATTNAPWQLQGTFNGVIYVDGGARISGPERSDIALPDTAAPAIASFARLTLATDGVLTVLSDLKYESPACSTSPSRDAGTGVVTPAVCPTVGYQRNVLGLFSSSANNFSVNPPVRGGINIKTTTKNTTIHAVMLASQGQIEVDGVPTGSSPCKGELNALTGAAVGNINIQGGLIQQNYGQFQSRPNAAGTYTCGYGRSMTFDRRMLDVSYQPPAFPPADNIPWSVRFRLGSNLPGEYIDTAGSNVILPLARGFSRIK